VSATANRDSWRIVWIAFLVAVFGWGIGFYGPAVYLPTLHQTRGWSISMLSSAITAHYLLSAALVAALPEAYRRFGAGRVTFAGAILSGLGAVCWANAQQPWQLFPAVLVSGAGWAATSGVALNAIVSPWFDRDRPRAISLAFNGASVGGVLFAPLWTALIAAFGLAGAALILGVAMPAILCPLAWTYLRRAPAAVPVPGQPARPTPRAQLLRQPRFITLSLAFALGLFAQIGLFSHLIARLTPDFGPGLAAIAISAITLCAVFGRSLLGWLLGEHDRRIAGAASILMQAAGTLLLVFGGSVAPLAAGCILFGLGVGNLTSLPPLIVQREFSPVDVGTVVALVIAINQAVFAFAPAVFGWLHDLTAGYVAAFLLAAAAQIVAASVLAWGRRFR
jgi:MFS family permease